MRRLVALAGIAVLAAACGGGPTPTSSPSASSPAVESSSPIAPPSTAAGKTYAVRLPADGGKRVRVVVHDPAGALTGVRLPTATEAADVENTPMSGNAAIESGRNTKALVVSWIGSVCDRRVDVTVEGSTVTVAPAPSGPCDSMALGRAVTLRFKAVVDPSQLIVGYVPPSGSN
jgi:hypothetical protein